MISLDANLLLYAYCADSPFHEGAADFIRTCSPRSDVAISEFVLVEYYTLLRNPVVVAHPLDPERAVTQVNHYRAHPRWRIIGFPPHSTEIHENLWRTAATTGFARRRIYDIRLALCLQFEGVNEFATVNEKDFRDLGFKRVWNPLDQ